MLIDSLFLELLNNLNFGCNGCVIGSRLPQCIISLHSLEADKNVLHGVVKRMSHVQLSCDIWRRDHNGKRFFGVIHFRVKVLLLQPFFIQSVLNPLGIVGLCQFLAHSYLLIVCVKQKPSAGFRQQRAYIRGTTFVRSVLTVTASATSYKVLSGNGDKT